MFPVLPSVVQFPKFMRVKNNHRSKFSNLSNWKEEAWKYQGLNGIRTLDLRKYRCDALPTELWSHTLGARSIYWVHIFPWGMKTIRGGHGLESRWSPDFCRLLLSNCLNWKIYWDDHSSLSSNTNYFIYSCFDKGCLTTAYYWYMGCDSLALLGWGLRGLARRREKAWIHTLFCVVPSSIAEIPWTLIKQV